jgi:hypothetical protein
VSSGVLETIDTITPDWTTYSYQTTAAADVSEGVTSQVAVICGGVASCSANVFLDNFTISIN